MKQDRKKRLERIEGIVHRGLHEPIATRQEDGNWRVGRYETLTLTPKGLRELEAEIGRPVRRLDLKSMNAKQLQAAYNEIVGSTHEAG